MIYGTRWYEAVRYVRVVSGLRLGPGRRVLTVRVIEDWLQGQVKSAHKPDHQS